ncbi:MAG: bifunctional phosphoglucose/phosphomannose isomerase [Candidatus Omnitrophica bacterium]|nr:bifunctional phosphoglucose/phosphomannose isomerase [Candidatus Omnitrophota bacterium]
MSGKNLDRSHMVNLLRNFSKQVEDAIQIGEGSEVPRSIGKNVDKILFVGMGGSAIGGDVIRSLFSAESSLAIGVSRHYDLPKFIDSKTLCIFSSYSGNTEETLSAFRQGLKKKLKSVIMTSGGELGNLSKRFSIPWIKIPQGFPPRTALGYSVFPVLRLLANLKLYKWNVRAIRETVSLLGTLGNKKYAPEIPFQSNPAKQLAKELWNRFVVIYAGAELLDSAALRFRNQIEENAKAIASHHILPEMNHNEILGWKFPEQVISACACVFLKDSKDHERIKLRFKITEDILAKQGVHSLEIRSQGESRLARLFSTIHLGDWVSYYLALLYEIDPTPVVVIESLKRQLAKA